MRTSHSVFQKVIRPSTGCARGRGPWRPTCATGSPCAGLGTRDPVTPPRPRPYLLVLGGPLQARGRPRGHASGAQGPLPGCPRPRVPAAPPPRPGQCGPDTRAGPSCGAGMLMRATVAAEEALWASGPSAGKPFRRPLSPGNPLRFPPPRSPHPAPHQPCAGLDPAASLPGDQAGGDGSVRVRNGGERGARRRGALVFSSLLSLSGRQEVRCRSPCGETSMVSDLCGRPVLSLSPAWPLLAQFSAASVMGTDPGQSPIGPSTVSPEEKTSLWENVHPLSARAAAGPGPSPEGPPSACLVPFTF